MQDADVIVIGAGMAGASIAAELAPRARVIVLEAEDAPGRHTTGRSAALFSEIYGNAVIRALTRASRPVLLEAEDGRFAHARACLHIARADQMERLEAFAALPDVAGSSRRLSAAEARAAAPRLRSDYVAGAVEELNACDLDVDALHQHYLRLVKTAGGRIVCDARAERIERSGGAWRIAAGGDVFTAPRLVNAAGAWGDVVADLAGARPIGLAPLRRTIALVAAPEDWPADHPAIIDIDEDFYLKPSPGRLMLCPADETPSPPCDAHPDELDIAIAVDRVQAALDLPVRRVEASWAGLRTFAPDRTPVLGYAEDGFFWCVGQGGYGIQTAPAMGRLGAALVLGEGAPAGLEEVEVAALSPGRLS